MNLKEFGGEKAIVNFLKKEFNSKNKKIAKGIGDDAAVIKRGNTFQVITTDMLCEDDHFSLNYFTPFQIGYKSMEASISDVYAMGATPTYTLVSVSFKKNTSVEFFKEFFRGIKKSALRHNVQVIGGDTTHGKKMSVSITVIGETKKPVYRRGAKENDLVFVTGKLGGSTAGLECFRKKIEGNEKVKQKHTNPNAQKSLAKKVAEIATALEDVSDGLATEIKNICAESKCGAIINAEQVPISMETKKAAKALKKNALDFALFGGEDFELVFTVHLKNRKKAKKIATQVGTIIKEKKVYLKTNSKTAELKKTGFDHFK
jgi:thiamine-monophosphate kinase